MSNLLDHAKRELALVNEDEQIQKTTLRMIEAFTENGHSGSSAHFHIQMVSALLRYENLSPLTADPGEWNHIADDIAGQPDLWQSARRPDAFSHDGGATYYLLSEDKWRRFPKRRVVRTLHTSAGVAA